MNLGAFFTGLALTFVSVLGLAWLVRCGIVRLPRLPKRFQSLAGRFSNLLSASASPAQSSSENASPLPAFKQLPVRYYSSEKSHSPLRLVPWDARGVLQETEQGFRFSGSSVSGEEIDMNFPSDDVQINYQKGNLLWDGGFAWCVIESNGEKHYFTSDHDTSGKIGAADKSTSETLENLSATGIYRSITKRYIQTS